MDDDADALTQAWAAAQARLPEGSQLDALRCASTGLAPDERSADWIAVAVGPEGQERWSRATDPVAALAGVGVAIT